MDYLCVYFVITERFSEVNCFRREGESNRDSHAIDDLRGHILSHLGPFAISFVESYFA